MLALALAEALLEKFGEDDVDGLVAAVDRYRQRLRPLGSRAGDTGPDPSEMP